MFSTQEPILVNFDRLDDHQERIRFYEQNSRNIFTLEPKKQFYFTYHYIDALFQLGKYTHVLSEIDQVIEYTFINNVEYQLEGTYEHLLFIKARSFAQLLQFEDAIDIGQQLIGIDLQKKDYQEFLEDTHCAAFNYHSATLRFTVLVLIFSSSIFSAIYWFINYEGQVTSNVDALMITVSPCLLALTILLGAHLFNKHRARRATETFVQRKLRMQNEKKII